MSQWPSAKARAVLAALFRIGWYQKRQSGSHRTLARNGWPDFVFAFHDGEEIGPANAFSPCEAHRSHTGRSLARE
jgi:predicted RNA binding protein YcfA (HicA-like mRNA interferase family)